MDTQRGIRANPEFAGTDCKATQARRQDVRYNARLSTSNYEGLEKRLVDCLVISPEFELMGIDYNFFPECLGEFEDWAEAYLFFLKASMEGKRPDWAIVILTPEQPSQEVLDTFRTPITAHQDYTVVCH